MTNITDKLKQKQAIENGLHELWYKRYEYSESSLKITEWPVL